VLDFHFVTYDKGPGFVMLEKMTVELCRRHWHAHGAEFGEKIGGKFKSRRKRYANLYGKSAG
jgi:hypothetical protein